MIFLSESIFVKNNRSVSFRFCQNITFFQFWRKRYVKNINFFLSAPFAVSNLVFSSNCIIYFPVYPMNHCLCWIACMWHGWTLALKSYQLPSIKNQPCNNVVIKIYNHYFYHYFYGFKSLQNSITLDFLKHWRCRLFIVYNFGRERWMFVGNQTTSEFFGGRIGFNLSRCVHPHLKHSYSTQYIHFMFCFARYVGSIVQWTHLLQTSVTATWQIWPLWPVNVDVIRVLLFN